MKKRIFSDTGNPDFFKSSTTIDLRIKLSIQIMSHIGHLTNSIFLNTKSVIKSLNCINYLVQVRNFRVKF